MSWFKRAMVALVLGTLVLPLAHHHQLIAKIRNQASANDVTLVGYWPFDEGSGEMAHDVTSYSNNGAIHGGGYVPGRFGTGLMLDGIDDYVDLGNPPELNPSNALTIEAWCLPLSDFASCGTSPIVDKGYFGHSDPFYQYHLSLGSGDNGNEILIFGHPNGAHGGTWAKNEWVHMIATYSNKWSRLYVNGVVVDSQFHDINDGLMADYGKSVFFGKIGNLSGCYLNAVIDEIRIYSRALSSSEVALHYSPRRGDSDGSTRINISDAVYLVNYLFIDGPRPNPYLWVGDIDCDGIVSITDCVFLVNYIFAGGLAPCE